MFGETGIAPRNHSTQYEVSDVPVTLTLNLKNWNGIIKQGSINALSTELYFLPFRVSLKSKNSLFQSHSSLNL